MSFASIPENKQEVTLSGNLSLGDHLGYAIVEKFHKRVTTIPLKSDTRDSPLAINPFETYDSH